MKLRQFRRTAAVIAAAVVVTLSPAVSAPSYATHENCAPHQEPEEDGHEGEHPEPPPYADAVSLCDPAGDAHGRRGVRALDITAVHYRNYDGSLQVVLRVANTEGVHRANLERFAADIHLDGTERRYTVANDSAGALTVFDVATGSTRTYRKAKVRVAPARDRVVFTVPAAALGRPRKVTVAAAAFLVNRKTGTALSSDYAHTSIPVKLR